ncbi:pyridoxamine 5'-phosphate oxidase family protein [Actinomadura sp. WMMB 499]|uniref:pyridoxamine 5'-phosphate oxidase family protein n=1 Tax=Actinomadura sp. WMMB 499 TaxID=1219491 RepID=UPI001248904B|nr:pyridoxamine 5'-phosphate oxidase family protein [Actinomadura sp. WMMB 499]QFG21274.1 pyridoxamine 5'-phosphate oxidase family protein [Actinomadura sp. WMMB 499]
MDDLLRLDEKTCMSLLRDAPVGRVAWADDDGRVTVLPVNHVVDGDSLVFSTAEGGKLEAVRAGRALTFEADDLEPALETAWSVLVTGACEIIIDTAEAERVRALPLHPWPRSPKAFLVRLVPHGVTGRRIPLRPGGVLWETAG